MVADMRDRRRGVMIMPPVRPVPQRVAAPQRQQAERPKPSNIWELGAKLQQEQSQPKKESGGMGGGLGRGLGVLVNNPLTQNLLKPLEALDYGRRASILGTESLAKALPQELETALAAVGIGIPIALVDEAKVAEDDRSWKEKLTDPTYGWGQVSHTTGNKWLDRGIGLAGDIALDPLTYLTFGAAPLTKGVPTVGRAARFSRMGEAMDALRAAGKLDEPTIQALRRVGERGYGAADDALLEAMGLQRSGARLTVPFTSIQTGRIPFTGGLARGINTGTGAVRGAVNRSPRLSKLVRAPKELETATQVLTRAGRGSNDEFLAALTDVQLNNLKRSTEGFMKGLGSQELKQRSEAIRTELEDAFGGDLNAYLNATELDPNTPTQLNALTQRMRELAAEKGIEIPELQGMGYLPHVLSAEFRELLHEGGDRAKQFMQQTGVRMDDTLRESGFLQHRALRPDPGSTMRVTIGDKTIELKTGSIAEINEKVKELFPELKTTALETDPMTMFERYIPGVASDVGNRSALKTLYERGNPFVMMREDLRIEPLRAKLQSLQDDMARLEQRIIEQGQPPDLLRERRILREQIKQAQDDVDAATWTVRRGEPKPLADDDVFRPVLDVEETSVANERIFKQAATTADEQRMQAEVIRLGDEETPGLAEELSSLRTYLRAPMSAKARRIPRRVQALEDEIADVMKQSRSQSWQKRRVRKLAQDATNEVEAEIAAVNREIRSLPRRLRKASAEEQRAYIQATVQRLHDLRAEGEALLGYVDTSLHQKIRDMGENLRRAQADLEDAIQRHYRPSFPEGIDPDALVARAEATQQPSQSQLWPDANSPDRGTRPISGAMDRPPGAQRFVPDEAAVAQTAAHREARQAWVAADEEVKRLQRILDEPQRLQEAIIRLAEAIQRRANDPDTSISYLQGLVRELDSMKEQLPAARARIRAEKIKGSLTAAKKQRDRLKRVLDKTQPPDIPYQAAVGEPPEIKALRERVSQEELALERGHTRTPEGWTMDELLDQRAGLQSGQPLQDVRRINALTRHIPATEEELMRGLRGEGVVGEIARDYMEQEANRLRSLRARREQLKGALQEIPEDLQREIDNIQANIDELRAYANELATDQAALLREREQLRAAVDASTTDPKVVVAGGRQGAAPRSATRGMSARDPELIKQQPLNKVIEEIETMARLNPGATDESLNIIEAQLQMYRRQLEQAAQHDLKANQAMDVARAAKDKNFVRVYTAALRDGWAAIPGHENTFVRSELRRMMQNAEQAVAQPGLFGSVVQAMTNFFKTYATLSPGFHVRNALSATFMNTTDGVALRNQLAGVHMWRDFVRAKDPLEFYRGLTPRWQQAFDAVFATGAGGRFFESGVAEATAIGRTKVKEGIFRNRATILSQRAGQRVEGSVRLGMALDTIKNGGSLEDAINRITRVHFDYSQVSKFDENMKRLIPFWTFMSRNLPLQFTQMWMKPKVYNWYKSFVRNVGTEAPEFTPEYITEGGGFNTGATTPEINIPFLGAAEGMPIFASPDFAQNRYEADIARLTGALSGENWGQILSDFNPYLTAPLEYATDRDLFTGRTYQPDDWRKASGITDMAMLPILAATGQVRRGGDGGIYYQEKGVDAFRSMIPVLDRISRLAPGTAGGEADDRQMESMLRFLGVPIRTISDKQMQNERRSRVFEERDQRRLQQALGG